jgi:hypothetical protein
MFLGGFMRLHKALFVLFSAMVGSGAAVILAQGTLAEFGINENEVKQQIVRSLAHGNISIYPDRKLFKAATPGAKAAFARNALSWLKTYTESPAFKADYARQREAAKPGPQQSKGTADEQVDKALAEQRKSLEETKKNVAKMSPDMQKQMAPAIKQMEETIERMAKDSKMKEIMKQSYEQQAVSDQKSYQDRLASYEKQYPADPRFLIAARLRQFLDVSKDVVFDAKLVPGGGGKMKFADAQYENKSAYWKMCYRAEKAPVEAARAFATEWLKQLEAK